jgi:hypothetical protein
MLTAWRERAPPPSHFVMASYSVMEPLRLFKTCKRGCCVYDNMGDCCLLPRYWREATDTEILHGGLRSAAPTAGVSASHGETFPRK